MPGVSAIVTAFLIKAAVHVGIALVSSYVVSALFGKRNQPQQRGEPDQLDPGNRQQLPPDTVNRIPVVYGAAYVKPIIVDAKISNDNQYMWYVLALCEAPPTTGTVTGTMQFGLANSASQSQSTWFGDKRLIIENSGRVSYWVDGAGVSNTKIADKIYVYYYSNGSNSQPPNATYGNAISIMSDSTTGGGISGTRWDNSYIMNNLTFMIVRMKYDSENGLTALEPITQYLQNTITKPGDVFVDYLTNKRYGAAVNLQNVNIPAFRTAANSLNAYSDEVITYSDPEGVPQTFTRYRIDGVIDTNKTLFDNLNTIADACDSWLQWNESTSQWSPVLNREIRYPTWDQLPRLVTSSQIIGGVQITPTDINQVYNAIEAGFPVGNSQWQDKTDFVTFSIPPSLRNTGEIENELRLNLPLTNLKARAYYLITKRLKQTREDLSINFDMDYSGTQIDAGDIIAVQHEYYGWTNTVYPGWSVAGKLFRVVSVREVVSEERGLIAQISATEYSEDVYDISDINDFTPAPNSQVVDPTVLNAPSNITITNPAPANAIPNFTVSFRTSNIGIATGSELWYTTSGIDPNESLVDWQLYATDYALGAYTITGNRAAGTNQGSNVSIVVSGLPSGLYAIAVRNIGPSYKGPFGVY